MFALYTLRKLSGCPLRCLAVRLVSSALSHFEKLQVADLHASGMDLRE